MTNQDVVKELLALGKEITNEIKKTSISDDFDAGYKEGLSKANDMIYARLEKLLGEGRLEKEAAAATTAVMVKCQYVDCANLATTDAIGGDESGDEHVYLVCEYHAREMEPYRL